MFFTYDQQRRLGCGVSRHQVIKLVGQALRTLSATGITSGSVSEYSLLVVLSSFVGIGEKEVVQRQLAYESAETGGLTRLDSRTSKLG